MYRSAKTMGSILHWPWQVARRTMCLSSLATALERGLVIDKLKPRIVTKEEEEILVNTFYGELNLQPLRSEDFMERLISTKGPRRKRWYKPATIYPPPWAMVFENPKLPLTVDIDCGDGMFLMLLAKKNVGRGNYLGLETKHTLHTKSVLLAEQLKLPNLHFIEADASVHLDTILATYAGRLMLVTILCPNIKLFKKIKTRHLLKWPLVMTIKKYMASGGKIFMESEAEDIMVQLRSYFGRKLGPEYSYIDADNPGLYDKEGWLLVNPLKVPMERELAVLAHGQKIYRIVFERQPELHDSATRQLSLFSGS